MTRIPHTHAYQKLKLLMIKNNSVRSIIDNEHTPVVTKTNI